MVTNKLKEIRMRVYLMNQGEFAKILNVSQNTLSRYENGITPTLENALKISKKLNLSIEEIFQLDDKIF